MLWHLLEEIWRFKGLGLICIFIALVVVVLREIPKNTADKSESRFLYVLLIIGIIGTTLFLIYSNTQKGDKEKEEIGTEKTEVVPGFELDTLTTIDTLVSETANENKITYEFLRGGWQAVSIDSTINEEIRFESVSYKIKLIPGPSSDIMHYESTSTSPYTFTSTDQQYHRNIKLWLDRNGEKMTGVLYKIDDGTYAYARPIDTLRYDLVFTKKY